MPVAVGAQREQMQRQVARLEALHALSLEVLAQHEPELVIARALGLAVRLLDAESSGYWNVTEHGYVLAALNGASDVLIGTRLAAGSGLTGQIVGNGQSILVEDYRRFEGRIAHFSDVWRSMLLVPVKRGETVLGVLVVSNNARPGAFDGADLAMDLPLTLDEAVLGAPVRVPTLSGPVEIRVPPGANNGQTLRLRGKGLPGKQGPGDLFVTLRVSLPRDHSGLEQLAETIRKSGSYRARGPEYG